MKEILRWILILIVAVLAIWSIVYFIILQWNYSESDFWTKLGLGILMAILNGSLFLLLSDKKNKN